MKTRDTNFYHRNKHKELHMSYRMSLNLSKEYLVCPLKVPNCEIFDLKEYKILILIIFEPQSL
jgi:hypothetical protein